MMMMMMMMKMKYVGYFFAIKTRFKENGHDIRTTKQKIGVTCFRNRSLIHPQKEFYSYATQQRKELTLTL
jgi:hypothetical protein